MPIELMMLSNHLILCRPLLLLSIFPSIKGFPGESALPIRCPKYWSFSFSISPSNEYSRLISFRMDWFHSLLGCPAIKPFSFSKKQNCPKWYLGFCVQRATSPLALLHKHIWIHDVFLLCYAVCGILVPWPGTEATAPRSETQRLNYWTTEEVPGSSLKNKSTTLWSSNPTPGHISIIQKDTISGYLQ